MAHTTTDVPVPHVEGVTNRGAELVRQVAKAILDTIEEACHRNPVVGCPAGPLFLALSTKGMSLYTFEAFMSAMVRAGKVRRSGHCYFIVEGQ